MRGVSIIYKKIFSIFFISVIATFFYLNPIHVKTVDKGAFLANSPCWQTDWNTNDSLPYEYGRQKAEDGRNTIHTHLKLHQQIYKIV